MVDFFELSEEGYENDPHQVGDAKCKCCGYEWVAVAPVGTEYLECPNCSKNCGMFKE